MFIINKIQILLDIIIKSINIVMQIILWNGRGRHYCERIVDEACSSPPYRQYILSKGESREELVKKAQEIIESSN